jgi:hypothetical protein
LAFAYIRSIEIAHFFDQVTRKEYRLMAYYFAYDCIDQAILNLSHDYFYTVTVPEFLPDFHCYIDSVVTQGNIRKISVMGIYNGVSASRSVEVRMEDDSLSVLQ